VWVSILWKAKQVRDLGSATDNRFRASHEVLASLEAVSVIALISAFVTVLWVSVVAFLALVLAGARFVVAFTRLVPAVAKDDAAHGNLVMFFKKIESLKNGLIQQVAELVRRATQSSSLPS